jgi:membrane-bound serine protease (ClpP class)
MSKLTRFALGLTLMVLALMPLCAGSAQEPGGRATVIELEGAIGPAMSRYVEGALRAAAEQHSVVEILQIDTPGGLDTSMRDIIKAILASPVPVVAYVAPSGARAASAGTYILYACHVAAMAPATNLGAATPISIGGGEEPSSPTPGNPIAPASPESTPPISAPTAAPHAGAPKSPSAPAERDNNAHTAPATETAPAPAPGTASERKAVNDAVAYIRSLAQLRGRNADWGERAVRGAASLSDEDALQQHVVEIIAKDVPDLLHQLDGRKVLIGAREVTMHTQGLAIEHVVPDWVTRVLLIVSHPTIAYGLLLAGIWGLLLEGYHPGVALPGVVGALCLLLGLYALQLLGVNFAGLALMALGIGLIITEFFMPTYGSLGVGGLIAFVIGSIILFGHGGNTGAHVAIPVIGSFAVVAALVVAGIVALGMRARRKPITTGAEAMIGEAVEVVDASRDPVLVRYGGELWNAHALRPLRAGQWASIVKVRGLTLWVEPRAETSQSSP